MAMRGITEIIELIKINRGLKNDVEVAAMLGLTKAALSNHKTRKTIPYESLLSFCVQNGVSLDWLLTGSGEMIDRVKQHSSNQLDYIRQSGIANINDLHYVFSRMVQAYAFASPNNPIVVSRMKELFNVANILCSSTSNLKKINPFYIGSDKLVIQNLDDFKTHFVDLLLGIMDPKLEYRGTLRILQFLEKLTREGIIDLKDSDLITVKESLEPWCFLVAKRGLIEEIPPVPVQITKDDIDTLLTEKETATTTVPFYKSSTITATVHFSHDKMTCGFVFVQRPLAITFGCDTQSLLELAAAILLTKEKEKASANVGNWEIKKEPEHNNYYIQQYGVRVHVSIDEINDFIKIVQELTNDKLIRYRLIKMHVDLYGIV